MIEDSIKDLRDCVNGDRLMDEDGDLCTFVGMVDGSAVLKYDDPTYEFVERHPHSTGFKRIPACPRIMYINMDQSGDLKSAYAVRTLGWPKFIEVIE